MKKTVLTPSPITADKFDSSPNYIQKRICDWKVKKAKEELGLILKATPDKNDNKKISIKPEVKNNANLNPSEQAEIVQALYSAISGSGNDEYNRIFIAEAAAVLISGSKQPNDLINSAFHGGMISMAPKDVIESQLSAKLLILHSKAMQFMNSALNSEYSQVTDLNLNRATKLMRLHNETIETLSRYKRKGEQKMTVQHVNVNHGGQAIVAGAFSPGGGKKKKQRK